MSASAPIEPEVRRRMRQVISVALATRSCPLGVAAAEARGLGMGLLPSLPASMVDAVVTELLQELDACLPPVGRAEVNGQVLRSMPREEVVATLADVLARSLEASGLVLLRRTTAPRHRAGGA